MVMKCAQREPRAACDRFPASLIEKAFAVERAGEGGETDVVTFRPTTSNKCKRVPRGLRPDLLAVAPTAFKQSSKPCRYMRRPQLTERHRAKVRIDVEIGKPLILLGRFCTEIQCSAVAEKVLHDVMHRRRHARNIRSVISRRSCGPFNLLCFGFRLNDPSVRRPRAPASITSTSVRVSSSWIRRVLSRSASARLLNLPRVIVRRRRPSLVTSVKRRNGSRTGCH
jgi:hypothetical protein